MSEEQLGWSLDAVDQHREIDAVTAEDVRSDFQHCLKANPTLSLVGEEAVIRAAFEAGWR